MQIIKINKEELKSVVSSNREQHRAIFEEAIVGFRERVIQELDKQLERAKQNVPQGNVLISLPRPEDHTKDYDRLLRQLEMEVEDVVELEDYEFAQYVMDDWAWKKQWLVSNSVYSATAASSAKNL